ncbi:MAG: phosphatidate cytidylyltransferase [Selenomonadaceae bacterium]|nr:phosphatidate cytidylyltransferase [Selenomonadaceae bacterium]MBR3747640.1 phosphatidate cytidylyltransferase [Selenomonadaceae bacterium]
MALRIITGIIGIAIAAFVIQYGGAPFAGFAIFLSLLAWHEFSGVFRRAGIITTYIFGALTLILLECCAWLGNVEELLAVLTISMMMIFLLTVILRGSTRPTDACVSVAGVMYIGLPFSHLIFLRFLADEPQPGEAVTTVKELATNNATILDKILPSNVLDFLPTIDLSLNINVDAGCALVWVLFACTWASDTFAYFVGTAFGSHKLASTISPGKTVEGFFGSIIGTIITAVVVGTIIFGLPLVKMAVAGFVLALAATFGDLAESVLKRFANIKDSGIFLPGHGGVLDRFDSLFFTAPTFYYFVILAGIA